MSASEGAPAALRAEPVAVPLRSELAAAVPARRRGRGSLVRRALLLADVAGFLAAFLLTELFFGSSGSVERVDVRNEYLLFFASLPCWIVGAKLYRLYDNDEERADHTTLEDLVGVFHLVTTGTWLVFVVVVLAGLAEPQLEKVVGFWGLSIACVTLARAWARALCRRSPAYRQNTVVVGAGEVGQLVARKLRFHGEYGINLLGFLDDEPRERRSELRDLPVLGSPADLAQIVSQHSVDRVVVAFSRDSHEEAVRLVRAAKALDVQVDLVPRLFEAIGPHVKVHAVESLPLVGLPTAKRFPASRAIKRTADVVVAALLLVLLSPFMAYAAWRIRRESPGPVLFRHERIGMGMQPFTFLKFRTMRTDVDTSVHREYIKQTMSADAAPNANGLYKLEREDAVTPFGHWLRRTSLDELPQLWNVLRGEMSLVGPRPCLAYEMEYFAPHHFERFLVPAGVTGLWQVTARAHATFGEALDMDVAYARGWSLGLDLWLLCRTPLHILRREATA
jgi:exopolysaccharide biosynthesis polyprenyl glycosylphosphotransferase